MTKGQAIELRLKVPWGHVAAKAWGDSNDKPVLMVHGILDNAGSFDRLLKLLPDNFYYVAIDLPGHGLSSHMQRGTPLDYFSYVLTIRYVLDELRWQQVYYIGHSLGAHLGTYFSLLYPERITKLILLDGIAPRCFANEELLDWIKLQQNVAVEANEIENPRLYTKREILYALKNLRQCSLNTKAAEALFERAVTKVGEDAYRYNRDFRAKITILPLRSLDQCLHALKQLKVETMVILVDNQLPFAKKLMTIYSRAIEDYSNVHIHRVRGNHDVHNNYPERVSEYVCKFLNHIPSKL